MYLSEIRDGIRVATPVSDTVFEAEYDVIVCGVGTAGALTAIFAAEDGLSVLGIEQFTCPGGTHAAGGISGHYFGCPGGRHMAFDEKVSALRYCAHRAEAIKLTQEEALWEQGVKLLYETSVVGVFTEDKTVVGVRVAKGSEIRNFKAKIVMDCTAEAVVAHMAGCATEYGRASDGQTQPYSMVSLTISDGDYKGTNIDFGRVNQLDDWALSEATIFSRAYEMTEERQNRQFVAHRPLIGVREGRRIIAEEVARVEDLFADRQTETPMFFSYADLDKHGWDIAFDSELLCDWAIGANLGAYNVTVSVPYRALLPKGFDGLLVPCRALGVDRDISSCVRMVPDMKKAAEAAAHWAVLAIGGNRKLREVPYDQLRQKLTQSGCLNMADNRGYRIDGKVNWDGTPLVPEDVHFATDPETLPDGLKTEKPGQAIWSARRIGEKAIPVLEKALRSPDSNTAKHAAFALAILGQESAKPLLREMARSRDELMLKDCRKHNNLRGCMAIYWLGRLADEEITDTLTDLICNENEISRPVYHSKVMTTRYKLQGFNDVYFHFMSGAVMALIRIGDAHPHLRSKISGAFASAFAGEAYYDRITQKPRKSSEGNMVLAMKRIALSATKKWRNASNEN